MQRVQIKVYYSNLTIRKTDNKMIADRLRKNFPIDSGEIACYQYQDFVIRMVAFNWN